MILKVGVSGRKKVYLKMLKMRTELAVGQRMHFYRSSMDWRKLKSVPQILSPPHGIRNEPFTV